MNHSKLHQNARIGVVIPTYRAKNHILKVLADMPDFVHTIYVVDDKCPDETGKMVVEQCEDPRVSVVFSPENKGVGGAVMRGYAQAQLDDMDIMVKVDSDGQMDPTIMHKFVEPILNMEADYVKGNRFWNLEEIRQMPNMRLFGNAVLSLMTKFSSGYWNLFDPTNGYTAISAQAARNLPFDKISERYFFETDMLFRLNTIRAVVVDMPMNAKYEDEESHLKISKILSEFLFKHIRNSVKRIFYNYYLRDMSVASLELPVGIGLLLFGFIFGLTKWIIAANQGISTTAGTVMIAALPLIFGMQLILAFVNYDIQTVPRQPITKYRPK